MSLVIPKKRGRPSKADLAARAEAARKADLAKRRSDIEVLNDTIKRFNIMHKLAKGATKGDVRSTVVTGAPGTGKTHTVEQVLGDAAAKSNLKYMVVRGAVSAIGLYKLGYKYRFKNCVLVLDDADGIFGDEDGMNVLKAMCDSSQVRKLSWIKDGSLKGENDEEIPNQYEFEGSMIFISNLNFQELLDSGRAGKIAPHIEALMSRSLFLDLKLHSRQELAVWVNHVLKVKGVLKGENLSMTQEQEVLNFINENRDNLRELSIRTALKIATLIKTDKTNWKENAEILLCR